MMSINELNNLYYYLKRMNMTIEKLSSTEKKIGLIKKELNYEISFYSKELKKLKKYVKEIKEIADYEKEISDVPFK